MADWADNMRIELAAVQVEDVHLYDEEILRHVILMSTSHVPHHPLGHGIKPSWRLILTTWMLEVCHEENCAVDVAFLAIMLLDRAARQKVFEKKQLQLLGATCLFISSKAKEVIPLSSAALIYFTDFSITRCQLLECESEVCSLLDWVLAPPTPHEVVEALAPKLQLKGRIKMHMVQEFLDRCAKDCELAIEQPAILACAVIVRATRCAHQQRQLVGILKTIEIDQEKLATCLETLSRWKL